nr:hypothetical protein [Actinomycetota bacterium]
NPGTAVGEEARLWLDGFVAGGVTSLRKLGLTGLARGRSLVVAGQAPSGHAVQLDLMLGAAAIGGSALDTAGKARIKLSRNYRRGLARMRKARLTLQGVIRSAAGGGPPTIKRVSVTLKAPKKKRRR